MIRRFFIAINVILFLLSLFFLIKTATDKKEINRYYGEKFSYTETAGGEVELEMSDGETVRLRFDKEVVKAEQSYRVKDRAGQIYLTTFIYSYAREKEIHIERKFTDMLGELRLHNALYAVGYKTPSSSSYVLAGTSSYSTTLESENGKYYFYAVDDLGNRSQTYWIDLQILYPDPTVEQSGTDNSVYITWTNGNTATLNGDDYTKGTWIKTEGSYTVTVTNEYGLSTTKTFSITHNYVVTKIVEPTCTTKGYSVFKCTSCGDEYEGNVKLAFGHNYDVETIEATCTTYGCIKHTCLNCGDTYETDVRTALGHKYTETTKEATCTEDGGQLHTCTVCGYEYLTDTVKATDHDYTTRVVREPHCETAGERIFHCEKCGDEYYTEIPATGHNFELAESSVVDGENIRTYVCTNCGAITTQNMGEQYEKVSSYVEYLFEQYQPYMWWVLLATAGVWSVVMGVFFGIAAKNEDKEKARKMIKNYVIGLVVIAVILVACPYLVRGIAALIAG